MSNSVRLLLCCLLVVAVAARCGDDDAGSTNSDTGNALDGGDDGLSGLDVGDNDGQGADGGAGDVEEDGAPGDAADDAAEDGADDPSADAIGEDSDDTGSSDTPAEDAATGDGDSGIGDTALDLVADGGDDTGADVPTDTPPDVPGPDLPPGICADGTINPGEDCDDNNTTNLDGCDDECRYEQVQLLADYDFRTTATSLCGGDDRLNDALSPAAESFIEGEFANDIQAGTLNGLLVLLDLDDPAGNSDADLSLGLVTGLTNLVAAGPETIAEEDSWYEATPGQLAGDEPDTQLDAALAAGILTAGPFDLELPLVGSTVPLEDVQIRLDLGSALNAPDPPPDALVPGFGTFATGDAILCGDIPAASLGALPAPAELLNFCDVEMAPDGPYDQCTGAVVDDCTSILDVFQGGCTTLFLGNPVVVINPTNPDGSGNYGVIFNIETLRVHLVDNYPPAD